MKPQRKAFQFLILLEAAALIAVLAYGIVKIGKGSSPAGIVAGQEEPSQSEDTGEREHMFRTEGAENKGTENNGGKGEGTETNGSAPKGEPGNNGTEGGLADGDGENRREEEPPVDFSPEVTEKLASMTIEEKIAQMFLTTPEALTHNDAVNIARSGTRDAIAACPVGGLVYDAKNFQGKEQTKALLEGVQGYSMERIGLPLFLAVEETGGMDYSPLAVKNSYALQASPAVAGAGGDPKAAAEAGTAIAGYLKEEGFNLNLLPTAGLSGDLEEGRRAQSYGAAADTVSMMIAESITACRAGGIATAVGYFPWKGAGGSCTKGLEEWADSDKLVLKAAVNAGTDLVILGNAAYGALTGEGDKPCSLSKGAVDYLREEMEFSGLILTDSLAEEAVLARYSIGEAAVTAAKAGVDLLYCPEGLEEAYQAVLEAVRSGEIPESQVEAAAGRILTRKLSMAGGAGAEE